jgi:hypothetical protein
MKSKPSSYPSESPPFEACQLSHQPISSVGSFTHTGWLQLCSNGQMILLKMLLAPDDCEDNDNRVIYRFNI